MKLFQTSQPPEALGLLSHFLLLLTQFSVLFSGLQQANMKGLSIMTCRCMYGFILLVKIIVTSSVTVLRQDLVLYN